MLLPTVCTSSESLCHCTVLFQPAGAVLISAAHKVHTARMSRNIGHIGPIAQLATVGPV